MKTPPDYVIEAARKAAIESPCAKSKRALAVAAGAIECDRRAFVSHIQRLRPAWGVYGPGNPAPPRNGCEGTIRTAPANAQCLACGEFGQRCDRTGKQAPP